MKFPAMPDGFEGFQTRPSAYPKRKVGQAWAIMDWSLKCTKARADFTSMRAIALSRDLIEKIRTGHFNDRPTELFQIRHLIKEHEKPLDQACGNLALRRQSDT